MPAGPERGRRIFTDVFPPHVIERAIAEAVNAIRRQRTDDDVSHRPAILHIEHRWLTFTLTAAREVVAPVASVEHRGRRHHAGRSELHGLRVGSASRSPDRSRAPDSAKESDLAMDWGSVMGSVMDSGLGVGVPDGTEHSFTPPDTRAARAERRFRTHEAAAQGLEGEAIGAAKGDTGRRRHRAGLVLIADGRVSAGPIGGMRGLRRRQRSQRKNEISRLHVVSPWIGPE